MDQLRALRYFSKVVQLGMVSIAVVGFYTQLRQHGSGIAQPLIHPKAGFCRRRAEGRYAGAFGAPADQHQWRIGIILFRIQHSPTGIVSVRRPLFVPPGNGIGELMGAARCDEALHCEPWKSK